MKKIIFVDIPMREISENRNKQCYKSGNEQHYIPVIFPINAILAKTLNKEDTVKVVFLATITKKKSYKQKYRDF